MIARWAPLATILLIATILRFHQISAQSLWTDEIASLQLSAGHEVADVQRPIGAMHPLCADLSGLEDARSWTSIPSATATDTHPPLYFLLLRFWRDAFGPGDAAARSFSAVCSILAIIALYDAVQLFHGRSAAIWAAAIMAVASPQIAFAQETRGYAMLILLLLCTIAALVRIEKLGPSKSWLTALGLAALAACFTHYSAIVALLALAACTGLQMSPKSRRESLAVMLSAGIVFSIIWGPTLWGQRQFLIANLAWISDAEAGLPLRTLGRLASLPMRFFIASDVSSSPALWLGALMYLAPLVAWWRRELLIWVLPAAAIIGATTVSDLVQHRAGLTLLRFTIAAAPAFYVLVAIVAMDLKPMWLAHLVPALFLLGCVAALPEIYKPTKPDFRRFAHHLDNVAGPDHLLIIPYRSRKEDWASSILLSAVTHYSNYPHRPTLALSGPNPIDASNAWILLPWGGPGMEQIAPGANASSSYTVPFVGLQVRVDLTPTTAPTSQP